MRLAIEQERVVVPGAERGGLLSLGWSGLGKLVQIESLALLGMEFEQLGLAGAEQGSVKPPAHGDAG